MNKINIINFCQIQPGLKLYSGIKALTREHQMNFTQQHRSRNMQQPEQ